MPGILPMKVIKVGTSAHSRIAQACDRCRSKKIRCDGITPCCSQCANVGFECKTSDKLSRRAFPRGYTESLEERVRSLEGEVKELTDLLDGKDEKIEMLSKMQSNTALSRRLSSTCTPSNSGTSRTSSMDTQSTPKEEAGDMHSSALSADIAQEMCSANSSNGRSFIDAFKKKSKATGKQLPNTKTHIFFTLDNLGNPLCSPDVSPILQTPSRMASDQMMNIWFQEWSPLFPVLHRPTTLQQYADFVACPDDIEDQNVIAQLYLVFSIASLSAEWNKHDPSPFESQWQPALEIVGKDLSINSLQSLVLAQLYCIAKGDLSKLRRYKGLAVKLARRLGLRQVQKRSSLGPLALETRKRVFWTLYTIDCFSAILLGEPRQLEKEEMACELPQDVDDENVTAEAFLPALPGESTRLSSALALFRGAQILSEVLDEMYPASPTHSLSLRTASALNDELDAWLASLPPHLRLQFLQDKPSTKVVGSRSPFLSLTYHTIRTLIHRPLAAAGTGNQASSSIVVLAQSSKHIVQIIQLLEERRMSFSFCLNKDHTLTMAGFGLLFQTIDLDRKGKLIKDSERLLCAVASILERKCAPGAIEFKKIACTMISVQPYSNIAKQVPSNMPAPEGGGGRKNMAIPAPKATSRSPRKIQSSISRSTTSMSPPKKREGNGGRRSTAPLIPTPMLSSNTRKHSDMSTASKQLYQSSRPNAACTASPSDTSSTLNLPNLDYLDFSNEPATSSETVSPTIVEIQHGSSSTDAIEIKTDEPDQPSLDTIFPAPDLFSYISETSSQTKNSFDWCTEFWTMPTDMMQQAAQSTLSFSEEDITSGEELSSCGGSRHLGSGSMPKDPDLTTLDALEGTFVL